MLAWDDLTANGFADVVLRLIAMIEAVRQEEREKAINEAQDELVRQDAFTERSLRILDGLRVPGQREWFEEILALRDHVEMLRCEHGDPHDLMRRPQ